MSLYQEYDKKWLFWLHIAIIVIVGAYILWEACQFENQF